jgi:putative PIN family toxin of toxin-antitoxin system
LRAVLDPNVLIAAVLSRTGAPAQILSCWLRGYCELVISEKLLAELERALAYPRLRRQVAEEDAEAFIDVLRRGVRLASDPAAPSRRSGDPGDDYLLALAEAERAVVVSGDRHLLALAGELPIQAPRTFLDALVKSGRGGRS